MREKMRAAVLVMVLVEMLSWGRAEGREEKTLRRQEDPVIVEGRNLSRLKSSSLPSLGLMSFSAGGWKPIPFQIDEKKTDGTYAFPFGPEASMDLDPLLDDNDELVFMVQAAGDRVEGSWPEGAETGVEIEMVDPKDGSRGWVYLFRFSELAPRSAEDYVRLEVNASRRRVVTTEYALEGPTDRIYPDFMARVEGDGKTGPDILDRLKIRGKFYLPLDVSLDFLMDEWAKCRDAAYLDGPVRILQLSPGYLELTSVIKIEGSGYSIISYYPNHVIWPMFVELPVDLRPVIKKIVIYGFMDFNANVYQSHPFSAANPFSPEVVLDGKMNEAEKKLDRESEISWIAGFGPQGALVSRLIAPPEWKDIKMVTYYQDDETALDQPEDDAGLCGVGYTLLGFEKMGKWSATFYQYYYFKRELAPEEVSALLDIRDHPLQVKVRPVEVPP